MSEHRSSLDPVIDVIESEMNGLRARVAALITERDTLKQQLEGLPAQIMNIRAERVGLQPSALRVAYREGHRDARHAAAELVTPALASSTPQENA